jgi:hypothetical protein
MKNVKKKSYDFVNKNSTPWYIKADELMHAGIILRNISLDASIEIETSDEEGLVEPTSEIDVVLKNFSLLSQATMLIGFAIENYLKGLWIEQNSIIIEDEINKLPKELNSHDLARIAKCLKIELKKPEINVLNFFTESVKWQGRYPIPLFVSEYFKYYKSKPGYVIENRTKDCFPIELESILRKIREKINNNNYPLSSSIISS